MIPIPVGTIGRIAPSFSDRDPGRNVDHRRDQNAVFYRFKVSADFFDPTGAAYPRNRKGLRRYRPGWRLSPDDARDSVYSHAGPFHDPILAQTLGRLSVSRGLG